MTCGTPVYYGIALLVHGYLCTGRWLGPHWRCPQTVMIAFSSFHLQYLILYLTPQLALNNICPMNKLELIGNDESNMLVDCRALKGRSFKTSVFQTETVLPWSERQSSASLEVTKVP